ncbi:MAG TPA: hydantoinase B/oxoprolinase family protein [Rhodopila sp.]|uniref:hydantoinase B/oxoprolinase family protein n=1 Tax=Rhodopila sp. TaxID=2480087 RepID=UPI002B9F7A8D|nr:hydantoinase B/oxoprolinase family protein [Rhodopila sp.]HVY15483.1 hydantoinase B/oxoprolinase family protein [Rhodopila sp.]
MRNLRLGFDIGGTFTDFVLADPATGALRLHKCLTTPEDPAIGALDGLRRIVADHGARFSDVAEIVHGTTLVTNAVIERKGARLGLITTAGFRDVLEAGTEQRYDIYDLFLTFPEPLVPRRRRLEVTERVDRDGNVVTALDADSVRRAARALRDAGAQAVAICFLNAYREPKHERDAAAIVAEMLPGIPISLSSDVVAEIGEYARCVTTCANAYVQPLMAAYLQRLEQALRSSGFTGPLRLMHSAGGLVSVEAARAVPIRLLESGPAGGALAAALLGERAGHRDLLAFDMGGTTAKACLIEDGRAQIAPMLEAGREHRFKKGSGLPIKAATVDMIEIGAGGGSIAAIDTVGLLRVGPRSAGAAPGPACYGKGGAEPTVTDANLALGYYDPAFFLGGTMALDVGAARAAIARLAGPLGLSVEQAAWGIHKVVVEAMADAARVYLVERGKDPRRYAMVGFGGAGPAHAAEVARALGMSELVVPPASGAASALGFLAAPLSASRVRSRLMRLGQSADLAEVETVLRALEAEARTELAAGGVADVARVERSADMRLAGQMHEISVPLPDAALAADSLPALEAAFEAAYTARYAALQPGATIEAVNFRVTVTGPTPVLTLHEPGDAAQAARKGERQAWFGEGFVTTPVYDRYALAPGSEIAGPAIVEEREATTVVAPGDTLRVDAAGNLRIAIGAASAMTLVRPDMTQEQARAAIEADPIALEIMWSRLTTVVDEMWLTIIRTAFSLIIAESQDFACELLDPAGETLAHSPRAMPVFNLTLPRAVKALLARFPAHTLQPGDMLVTNDPWLCAGHLYDIAVVSPVFRDGQVVALVGTVGHVADIGGTRDSLRAREIFEEGLQIPPMKLARAGVDNEDLFALINENVRNPSQVIGDIQAFMAANRIGAQRLCAFMDEYGLADLSALAGIVQDRAEQAMRAAIRALPDGIYESRVSLSPVDAKITLPLRLTVSGDTIDLDFAGAPPQLAQGGVNSTLNYTAAHATYPLKCMLTPNVRGNAGCYRPFRVTAPEGSILNCVRPAAVAARTRTGWYLAPAVFAALADAAPDAVQSPTGLPVAVTVSGRDAEGRFYADHLFMGGGQGASRHGDGKSGLLYPTSAANTAIEVFEARVPVLVEEKTFLPDTGGAGATRGGLGQRVRFRKLHDDGQPTLAALFPEGVKAVLPGLAGGQPGAKAFAGVRTPDGTLLRDCGPGELVTLTRPGEVAEIVFAGGAGHGAPLHRPAAAVAEDLRDGRITETAAREIYGAGLSPAAE